MFNTGTFSLLKKAEKNKRVHPTNKVGAISGTHESNQVGDYRARCAVGKAFFVGLAAGKREGAAGGPKEERMRANFRVNAMWEAKTGAASF